MRDSSAECGVSIIVPVYNSAPTLKPLCSRIVGVMDDTRRRFEIVLVDDGSIDDSVASLLALARHDARIKIVTHERNLGQGAAVVSGIKQARGSVLVTLDDDLQHQPEDIPRLLERLEAAHGDFIIGVRANWIRPYWRESLTWLVNLISNVFLEKPLPLWLTNFCCLRRDLADRLVHGSSWPEVPWIATLVSMAVRTLVLPIQIAPSSVGKSRHSVRTLYRLFRNRTQLFVLRRVLLFAFLALAIALIMALISIQHDGFWGAAGMMVLAAAASMVAVLAVALAGICIATRFRGRFVQDESLA